MGRTMNIETTAEGVETDEQARHLRAEGCTQLQGFLYSKPRPAADVAAMLDEQADRAWEKPQAD
jgi:EAL domain-containing protein (putative c-di-GMP-specific phosphodiesterase class I)